MSRIEICIVGTEGNIWVKTCQKMEARLVVCKKCSGIMREASLSKGETTCLVCSDTPRQPNPVKTVQDSIRILGIKCPLLRDCDWKGELSEAETHLNHCLFFLIECNICGELFSRRDEEEHGKYCPKRSMYCDYCDKGGRAKYKEEHLNYCDGYPVSCPNKCGVKPPRGELSKHRYKCELELIPCPYKEYGCRAESMLRRDLLAHKKEFYIEHQDMSLVQIGQLNNENVRLKAEQNEMNWKVKKMKELDGVEWEIENIDILSEVDSIAGPTFYVNNYRLRIHCVNSFWGNFNFYVNRIEGKFDRNLGLGSITHYRVITVNTRDYCEFGYNEGTMNYQLKIGTNSEMIEWYKSSRHILLRFYFDVDSNPLRSLEVDDYEWTTSPDPSGEEDPWDFPQY